MSLVMPSACRGVIRQRRSDAAIRSIKGFTLIELVIFIIVMGILAVGILSSFNTALRGMPEPERVARAAQLAQERMELVLAQRRLLGFAGFMATDPDPCTSIPVSVHPSCSAIPTGYTVTTTLNPNWNADASYAEVVVSVTGEGVATLNTIVADY